MRVLFEPKFLLHSENLSVSFDITSHQFQYILSNSSTLMISAAHLSRFQVKITCHVWPTKYHNFFFFEFQTLFVERFPGLS